MLDLKSIVKAFVIFSVLFGGLLGLAHVDKVEKRLGAWFINSSSSFYEWALPQAAINVEHDRNPDRYNPNEVWISPMGREWLQEQIRKAQQNGTALEVDNEASLLFKIGNFPKTALVFLLSLILATPLEWKKKLKALGIGLVCFWLYFYLFIYLETLTHISKSSIGIYQLTGVKSTIAFSLHRAFCNFGFSLTFSLIVWTVTCIDFNALFSQFNTAFSDVNSTTTPVKSTARKKKKKKKKSTK